MKHLGNKLLACQINTVLCGDALSMLSTFPSESIDCCITSPPYYGLRDYNVEGQIGLEETPETYISRGVVAKKLGRNFIGIEINPGYCEMARRRVADQEVSQ